MGSLAGRKARREPAGEAKPDVCVISDGEAIKFKNKISNICHGLIWSG